MLIHRRRRDDQAGIGLIELLVAMFVLGIVLTGIANLTMSSLRATMINADRSVASNLAQAEIERLRTLPFQDLEAMVDEPFTETVDTEDGAHRLQRWVTWQTLETNTDPCVEPFGSTMRAVLLIDVAVNPVTRAENTSTSSTQIARPPTTPTTGKGALAVKVTDHQDPAQGVPAVTVTVRRSTGAVVASAATDADGCVLFMDLDAPVNYQVNVAKAQHVSSIGPNDPSPTIEAGVEIDTRTVLDVPYAPQARAVLGAAVRDGSAAFWPTTLPITLSRDGLVTTRDRGTAIQPIWPGRWQVWAGDCSIADPAGIDPLDENPFWEGAERQNPSVLSPVTAMHTGDDVIALVPRTTVTYATQGPTPPGNAGARHPHSNTLTAISAVSAVPCAGGRSTLDFGAVSAASPVTIGLPHGRWTVRFVGRQTYCGSEAFDWSSFRFVCTNPNATRAIYGDSTVTVDPRQPTATVPGFSWRTSP